MRIKREEAREEGLIAEGARLDGGARPGPFPCAPVTMIVGNFGSGKTEVTVNWALALAGEGWDITVADLDIVNPYFRCREARDLMTSRGIRVVLPPAPLLYADLPIVVPEIKGLFSRKEGVVLMDVGGDDGGARILSSFAGAIGAHDLIQVINARRPFTDTVQGCVDMARAIEGASRLRVTALAGNTHLMDETDLAVLEEGAELVQGVAEALGLPVRFITAPQALAQRIPLGRLGAPVLPIDRTMLPPWRAPLGAVRMGPANFKL